MQLRQCEGASDGANKDIVESQLVRDWLARSLARTVQTAPAGALADPTARVSAGQFNVKAMAREMESHC